MNKKLFTLIVVLKFSLVYSQEYPISKLNIYKNDSLNYKYCFDQDSNSNRIYFLTDHIQKIDSNKLDSTIIVKICNSDHSQKNHSGFYFIKIKDSLVIIPILFNNEFKINQIPKDSVIIIGETKQSLNFIIVKVNNFYNRSINFTFPFSNKNESRKKCCIMDNKEIIDERNKKDKVFFDLANKKPIKVYCEECDIVKKMIENIYKYGFYRIY